MKMRTLFSRFLLKIFSFSYSLEEDRFPTPSSYKIFKGAEEIPREIKQELIKCYQQIFADKPWYEEWSKVQVEEKIEKDMDSENSIIIVIYDENRVKGFAWGAIVSQKDIGKRASRAMNVSDYNLNFIFPGKGEEKVLYCDELALAKEARVGINPLRYLVKELLFYGYWKGVKKIVFWSTPQSKIVPIAEMMGYEYCGRGKVKEKEIVFLLNREFTSLFKITKNLNTKRAEKFMALQQKRKRPE